MATKGRNISFEKFEADAVRAWSRHANPINQALANKWKNGEPKDRKTAPEVAREVRQAKNPPRYTSWSSI